MPGELEGKHSPFVLKGQIPVTPVQLGWAAQERYSQSLIPQLTCKAHSTCQGAQMQVSPNLCPFCTLTCSRKDLCNIGSSLPCPV